MMNTRPVVVVLAAGRGERFEGDGHKLEQALGAEAVLCVTIRHVIESQLPLVVVCAQHLAPLVQQLVAARDVVLVPEAGPSGMGDSIAAGVRASTQASGWLICPATCPKFNRPACAPWPLRWIFRPSRMRNTAVGTAGDT